MAIAAEPVLHAQRVDKTYDNGFQALRELSLQVGSGEFVSLLGPSGCGKSTLLRLFAGLESPTAGHLRWWGSLAAPAAGAQGGHGSLAMVFQEPTLLPWATVLDNVRLPFDLAGQRGEEAGRIAAQAIEQVGLTAFLAAYPRELSGGMQMRVAIARALASQPDLLLMDEPFGALDEFTRQRLDDDLRGLWCQRPVTVVFVTHSIYEAVFLSNRIVVMGARPGRVVADLPVEGPRVRDQAFRLSAPFMEYCRTVSQCLARAHQDLEVSP